MSVRLWKIYIQDSKVKGLLNLKCIFGVFTFFKKMNENKLTSSKIKFVRLFLERNVGLTKSFQICLTFSGVTTAANQLKSVHFKKTVVILNFFKIVVLFNTTSADIKTKSADVTLKSTTILKEMRIAQPSS